MPPQHPAPLGAPAGPPTALEELRQQYQGSTDERRDLLASYSTHNGDMNAVFEEIMLSDPVEDEARFRDVIEAAIRDGQVESHRAFTHEPKASRANRVRLAKREAVEAIELAKELGVHDKLFGDGSSKKQRKRKADDGQDEDALKALIQQRQSSRAKGASFLDALEAKYGGGRAKTTKKPRTKGDKKDVREEEQEGDDDDEPPEEAFRANASLGRARAGRDEAKLPKTRASTAAKASKGSKSKKVGRTRDDQ